MPAQPIMMRTALHLLTGAALLCAGCMSAPVGPAPALPRRAEPAVDTLTYSIEIENRSTYGTPWRMTDARAAQLIERVLEDSGVFRNVREAPSGTGVHMDCRLKLSASPIAASVNSYSFLTAYLLPLWMTHRMSLSAEIYARRRFIDAYTARAACKEIHWLPLIVASPFATSGGARNALCRRLIASILLDAQQDRLFPISEERIQSAPTAPPPAAIHRRKRKEAERRVYEALPR